MRPTLPMPPCSTEFFGFSHRPFRGTPDLEDYVAIEAIDPEVQRLAAAAAQGDGIAVLTAAPGVGKTLVCQRLQAILSDRFEAVLLSSSGFATRRALLQAVLFALGQSYESCSEQELRLSVLNYARMLAESREGIVLIIDEAHLLNIRLLEELRCLTNHAQAGQPLIRVVLCGQLPLEDALVDPALEALNYRITCHATLEPLSMQESAQLIAGRLQRAGRRVEEIFTPEALETICRVSDGNPRCLVQLCDESLRIAADRSEVPVEAETVRLALHDLKQLPLQWNESAIDQPQSAAATTDAAAVPGDAWAPTTSYEDSLKSQAPETEFAADDGVAGWSASVASVELGADCDLCDSPPATAGWSSFEPQSGWEPSGAAKPAERDDPTDGSSAAFPICGSCDGAASSIPLPRAEKSSWSDPMAERLVANGEADAETMPADTADVAAEGTCAAADGTRRKGFIELPVDDVYASLDAQKPRLPDASETGSFDRVLRSTVTTAPRGPRPSAREPIADAEPSGPSEPVLDPSDGLRSDPVQRLDAVIAALSAASADGPAEPAPSCSEWQSAGDCRAYDVLEPGGEPRWDQPATVSPAEASAADAGIPPSASADRPEQHRNGHAASTHHPLRRPYARLFSRARQQQS